MTGSSYSVGDYLADRLVELGVDRVFGVPGDYTLALLDSIVGHPSLEWTGCTNELNAGYAADGYARTRGFGALMTTFGVGELSAINAIAGSFAEHVPVVHIVGSPSSGTQAAHRIVHHSLGDGIFTQFLEMHRPITCARATLNQHNATSEIDRVLTEVRDRRLPGYLLLPADVALAAANPPDSRLARPGTSTDPVALEGFSTAARSLIETAGGPSDVRVLGGLLTHRFGAVSNLQRLLDAGPLLHATSLWGKSLVDESDPYFLGVYAGAASEEVVRQAVEDGPVLVLAGVQFTDLNSGFFTQDIHRTQTIEIGASAASVGAALFSPLSLTDALDALVPIVKDLAARAPDMPAPRAVAERQVAAEPMDAPLVQTMLWDEIARFLRPGDIVLADQGCSFYGAATRRLPVGTLFIGQPLWASIGYTLPALLGACLADPDRRGVLLIGDGAAQMTAQELSTFFREGLAPTIVVLDNAGYTVERAIHGPDQPYNDIARWDWTVAGAMLAPDRPCLSFRVTTPGELRIALDASADAPDTVTIIQAVVDRMDIPPLLASLARAASAANVRSDH
jgi:alpha-keto-acid decarboxylase